MKVAERKVKSTAKYKGKLITANGNQLVANTEALISEAGVFFPITPSTEMGEMYQQHFAKGDLNAFGQSIVAVEAEGEHAAQGGAIAMSVTGKRTVNFTSGQGIVYGIEQYYHAPGKLSTMVLEVGARALTKHALNVHCGHDDVYAALDTGWNMIFAKDAQQAVDQALILRKVNEKSLNPGMNAMDGFLTTHLERTFRQPEAALVREFLGKPDDIIDCPTEAQRALFGPTRRRVPRMVDLENPVLLGPVQNQEHYMNGVAARRNNFSEDILGFFEEAYAEFAELTGRKYGLISEYNCAEADTVFIALGSAVENIEAAVDHIGATTGEIVGAIHINVMRPFPEAAIVEALRGKKRAIILERTDESLAGDNPLSRDIRVALSKGLANSGANAHAHLGKLEKDEVPQIFAGVYGLGSRDFRPEGILGAYEYSMGRIARKDGVKYSDGKNFFFIGIDHPYAVVSQETPSLLPANSISVRFHSVGGWGMITTGKNLGGILGELSNYTALRDNMVDEDGKPQEIIHISANPKYGSEKKGAPTNYFMVAAKERVRVNCDLHHVNAVLCCDPKAFLHTNPIQGLEKGGAFVWESNESPDKAWQRIPKRYRKQIIEDEIKVYLLNGFDIAKEATKREDLQTRMQGNSFLGSFFKVSTFLKDYNIGTEEFLKTVRAQYNKKFGKLGEKVVESNMRVMQAGFDNVVLMEPGDIDAPDHSAFMGNIIHSCFSDPIDNIDTNGKSPMFKMSTFDEEYRSGLGYDQPASPLASLGIVAAATGLTASKYVSRRQVPLFLAENCTQCMECMVACPDTAMPSTAQDISTILKTSILNYVKDKDSRNALLQVVPTLENDIRAELLEHANDKEDKTPFKDVVIKHIRALNEVSEDAKNALSSIFMVLPIAYNNTKGIFAGKEKKEPGTGGLFSIFINDLCKGCGACVEACGKHEALKMVPETEEIHAEYKSATEFLSKLRDTPQKYLGLLNEAEPQESKAAALKMHLMLQSKYNAFVGGDGACAGCGQKSVLRSVATLTETLMKPIFKNKAERLYAKADELEKKGLALLEDIKSGDAESYENFRLLLLHLYMNYGAESKEAVVGRAADYEGGDDELIKALADTIRHDAAKHVDSQTIENIAPNGMSVMAMTAHTGCNTVYGSTPPNNPHPYPWMNSLFQDGSTIGWLIGESFVKDHGVMSVIPERLTDWLLNTSRNPFSDQNYFDFTHFSEVQMTDDEVLELPKVWVIGGDGGMGDIGFQNVSKVVLQNRPNVKMLMLDTQVYSNTGGQNSDSSVMTGGFDMNQAGLATEGKLTEKKSVSEAFLGGHGSPYVAQVSAANSGTLYKSILDGLCYRGTAFYQTYTTCQPEHGVADHAALDQAQRIRDSRGMPEFVYDPRLGETFMDTLSIKGNPNFKNDWSTKPAPVTKQRYTYTVAHWAFTEARFRLHHKIVKESEVEGLTNLEDKLKLITQNDVVYRRYLDADHRSIIENWKVFTIDFNNQGEPEYHILSRQMVLFCVERRKAWRMLQSRAGIVNEDYLAQKEALSSSQEG